MASHRIASHRIPSHHIPSHPHRIASHAHAHAHAHTHAHPLTCMYVIIITHPHSHQFSIDGTIDGLKRSGNHEIIDAEIGWGTCMCMYMCMCMSCDMMDDKRVNVRASMHQDAHVCVCCPHYHVVVHVVYPPVPTLVPMRCSYHGMLQPRRDVCILCMYMCMCMFNTCMCTSCHVMSCHVITTHAHTHEC